MVMSKIFDALKRAEGQRRRGMTRISEALPTIARRRSEATAQPSSGRGVLPEAFVKEMGILRNALESSFSDQPKRSLLFTSATEGEGSTTIATGFARFLAMQGLHKILVCELNARRPAFTNVFSINGSKGVTDYFSSRAELASIVQTVGPDEIDVLHVGVQDPTIIQLHLAQVLPEFLEDAFKIYDTVIIDAPPVIECPETPPMTGFVDGVVMVVQAGRARRETVARSLERIAKFKGDVLGIVLNRKKYYIPEFLYKRI
jgi:capsular exopolysaccharide synthesis family protein